MRTLIVLLVLVQPCLAQFQGALSMRHTSYKSSGPMAVNVELVVKNDNAAGSFEGKDPRASGRFILRGDKKLLWIINDQDKSYLEISTNADKAPAGKRSDAGLTKTGKSKVLLGYPCDEYLAPGDGEERHIWATAKLGRLYEGIAQSMQGVGGHGSTPAWQLEMVEKRLVPLLAETYRDGTLAEKEEILNIEEKAVPATAFDPPAGYERRNLSAKFNEMYKRMGEKGGVMNEKDVPGMNAEMQKMLKQLQEEAGHGADTSGGGDD